MWRGETAAFVGRHYQLDEPLCQPQPLSRPHPPILIGGEGERRTLRLVATYGDARNFQLGAPLPGYPDWYIETYHKRASLLGHKLAVLREHCQAVGRPYEAIERTVLGTVKLAPGAMSADEVVEVCHELAELGVQQVIYNTPDAHDLRSIERIASEIIPRVRAF
jgi:alkanesulfonate monooxygenase SsuD/methylene tetrahydromethanopterin reductase-like flavin-dependent oxidoreductase (luciferase family)